MASALRFDKPQHFRTTGEAQAWFNAETNDWTHFNDMEYSWYGYRTEEGITVDHFRTSVKTQWTNDIGGGVRVTTRYDIATFKELSPGQDVVAYGHSHPPGEAGALGHEFYSAQDVGNFSQRQAAFGEGVENYLTAGGHSYVMTGSATRDLGSFTTTRLWASAAPGILSGWWREPHLGAQ